MIDQFVAFCFQKRVLAWMIAVFVCVYGVYAWTQLPVEAYPLFSDVYVQVTVDAPGLAAEEVEQQITVPLERALNGVPGLARMRSNSTFGLSIITMRFRDGFEDYWVRQRVSERIADVTLPAGISTSLIPMSAPQGENFRYTVQSDTKQPMEHSETHPRIIIQALH